MVLIDFVLTIIVIVLILGLLVFVHELGHFLAAKLIGVEVEEFAFGFGRNLVAREYKETVYKINLLPFGGYVKLLGDEDPSSFVRKYGKAPSVAEKKKLLKRLSDLGINDRSMQSRIKRLAEMAEIENEEREKLTKFMWNYVIPNDPDNMDNKGYFQKVFVAVAGVCMNMLLAFGIFSIFLFLSDYRTNIAYIADYSFIGVGEEVHERPVIRHFYDEDVADNFENYEEGLSILIQSIDDNYINNEEEFGQIWEEIDGKTVDVRYVVVGTGKIEIKEMVFNPEGNGSYIFDIDPDLKNKPILFDLREDMPAKKAGLEDMDMILAINGEDYIAKSTDEFIDFLEANQGKSLSLEILRADGSQKQLTVDLKTKENEDDLILGAGIAVNSSLYASQYYLDYSDSKILSGVSHSINLLGYSPVALGSIIKTSFETRNPELAAYSVSSVWGVGEELNTLVVNRDYMNIINMTGLISVALAFMNILPIPLLDGGQIVFLTIEKVRGKPLSENLQERIAKASFWGLITFSILIVVKDVWMGFIGDFFRGII